jgi:hypothetical protein
MERSRFNLVGFPFTPTASDGASSITFTCVDGSQPETARTLSATLHPASQAQQLKKLAAARARVDGSGSSAEDDAVERPRWSGRAEGVAHGASWLVDAFPHVVISERLEDLDSATQQRPTNAIVAIQILRDAMWAVAKMHSSGVAHASIDGRAVVRRAAPASDERWRLRDCGHCRYKSELGPAEWQRCLASDRRALGAVARELLCESRGESRGTGALALAPIALAIQHARRFGAAAPPTAAGDAAKSFHPPAMEGVPGERLYFSLAAMAEDMVASCLEGGGGGVKTIAPGGVADVLTHPLFLVATRDARAAWAPLFGDASSRASSDERTRAARSLVLDPVQLRLVLKHSPAQRFVDGTLGAEQVSVRRFGADTTPASFRESVVRAVAFEERFASKSTDRTHLLRCVGVCFDRKAVCASGERIGRCIVTSRYRWKLLADAPLSALTAKQHVGLVLAYARAQRGLHCHTAVHGRSAPPPSPDASVSPRGSRSPREGRSSSHSASPPPPPLLLERSSGGLATPASTPQRKRRASRASMANVFEIVIDDGDVAIGLELEFEGDEEEVAAESDGGIALVSSILSDGAIERLYSGRVQPGDELIAVNESRDSSEFKITLESAGRPLVLRFRRNQIQREDVGAILHSAAQGATPLGSTQRKRRNSRRLSVKGIRQVGSWTDLALLAGGNGGASGDDSACTETAPALAAPPTLRIAVTKRHRFRGLLKRVFVFSPGQYVATEKVTRRKKGTGEDVVAGRETNRWAIGDVSSITTIADGLKLVVYKGFAVQPPMIFKCSEESRKSVLEYWRWQRSDAAQQSAAALQKEGDSKRSGPFSNLWAMVDMLTQAAEAVVLSEEVAEPAAGASLSSSSSSATTTSSGSTSDDANVNDVAVSKEWHLFLADAPSNAADGAAAWCNASLAIARFAIALCGVVGETAPSTPRIRVMLTSHIAAALAKSKTMHQRRSRSASENATSLEGGDDSNFDLLDAFIATLADAADAKN